MFVNNFGKVIGIIGTRRRDTPIIRRLIEEVFWKLYNPGDIICSGGCPKGADRFADEIAKSNGIPILTIYPDYKKYKQGAPIVRNTPVAETSNILIACVVKPEEGIDLVLQRKTGGTEDTLRKFVKHKETKSGIYLL